MARRKTAYKELLLLISFCVNGKFNTSLLLLIFLALKMTPKNITGNRTKMKERSIK